MAKYQLIVISVKASHQQAGNLKLLRKFTLWWWKTHSQKTIRKIENVIEISHGSVQGILTEDLHMRRVAAEFLCKLLCHISSKTYASTLLRMYWTVWMGIQTFWWWVLGEWIQPRNQNIVTGVESSKVQKCTTGPMESQSHGLFFFPHGPLWISARSMSICSTTWGSFSYLHNAVYRKRSHLW